MEITTNFKNDKLGRVHYTLPININLLKMKSKIILIILLSSLFSCKKRESTLKIDESTISFTDSTFKTTNHLISKELVNITDSLLIASRIKIIKNYLLVSEEKGNKSLHIVDLPSDEYRGLYLNKGKGPGELLNVWEISENNDKSLSILDYLQNKIVNFNIDSLILKNRFKEEYRLDPSIRSNAISIHNNKIYTLDRNNLKYRLYEVDLTGKIIKGYGEIPEKIDDMHAIKTRSDDLSLAFMSNNKNKFVFAYYFYPLIEIFDIKTNQWNSIIGPINTMPSKQEKFKNDVFYGNVRTTEKYIYVLYKAGVRANGKIIYVFNYEGKCLKKLTLDKNIFTFDVYKDRYIYGINEEIQSKILKFEIKI